MANPTPDPLLDELNTLRQLTATMEDVYWISTHDKSRMLYVSPAYEKVFCRSCQSLYKDPMSFAEQVHPDDRQRLRDWMPSQARGPAEIEYRLALPTGRIKW